MVLALLRHPRKTFAVLSLMREAKRRGVTYEQLPEELVVARLYRVDVTRWGLAPDAEVVTRGPADPELDAACAAATEGGWEPAAALLASTRGDWERRDEVVRALADHVVRDATFLQRWHETDPDNGDLAVLHALSLVYLAWEARGTARAAQTSQAQFAEFHRLLRLAQTTAQHAATLLPDDPTPWTTLAMLARGLSYDHQRFGLLWDELLARDPHHRSGHVQALQYWCRKWHGSDELMWDFATRAAASPALAALPLQAALETADKTPQIWRSPLVRDPLETLLARLEGEGAATRALRSDRGLAITALVFAERYDEALAQFRVLGPHADGEPWRSYSSTPRMDFLEARIAVCTAAGKPA
ncbi:hypothetical protein [Saccharothrix syringae]|uniref:DUF4034 domain-containing protein n=1 Tax=Saccharothrix syringae TaxID=103733 RepID=A0A5Q0H1X7_SACSY|nr:hypothetical protein [Saccharothrix syringae]QFZ20103.1 DUF4034 domain-containing protein [Saccharothrix syringae]